MATQLFKKNAVLLAKTETTYGVDSAPSTSNGYLVRNLDINPMEGAAVDLEYVRPWYGQDSSLRTSTYVTVNFDTDWVPSTQNPGTASPFGTLFKACGFAETLTASPVTGTAQAGAASTITLAAGASAQDNIYRGMTITLTGGSGATSGTGSLSGNVLTVTAASGTFGVGQKITGTNIPSDTYIYALGTGSGGTGTYLVTTTGTAASTSLTVQTTGIITAYNGSTKVATVGTNWVIQPSGTTAYSIGANAAYDPVSTGFGSCTLYYNAGGLQHVILGARGTFTVNLEANQIPSLKFSFTGLYGGVTDVSQTTPTYANFGVPVAVNSANTQGFIHGKALSGGTSGMQLQKFSFDIGNQINYRLLVGSESVVIPDRKPKGSVTFEMTTVAFQDWFTRVRNGTTGLNMIQNGYASSSVVNAIFPKTQLENPKYEESDGIVMFTADYRAIWSAAPGNDEVRLMEK